MRTVLQILGTDAEKFLADLVTNTLPEEGHLSYSALLSPQGKYLFDFFIARRENGFWIDVDSDQAEPLAKRFFMYKLRADVTIERLGIHVTRGRTDQPDGAYIDPRDSRLGWRAYDEGEDQELDWDRLRVEALIPKSGIELIPNESYILEMGFERLNGVDFKKGCYVGQEVTARMKHKTELRKGLARVRVSEVVPVGTEITKDGKVIGAIYTQSESRGLAYLRFDRSEGDLRAGKAAVTLDARS
ncbi:MAG: folate-binding protein [Pseudomonadota bacterium]